MTSNPLHLLYPAHGDRTSLGGMWIPQSGALHLNLQGSSE